MPQPSQEVKVGQIWKDNDRREKHRLVRVESIDGRFAVCVCTTGNQPNRRYRIQLSRFRPISTGYVFWGDADGVELKIDKRYVFGIYIPEGGDPNAIPVLERVQIRAPVIHSQSEPDEGSVAGDNHVAS